MISAGIRLKISAVFITIAIVNTQGQSGQTVTQIRIYKDCESVM